MWILLIMKISDLESLPNNTEFGPLVLLGGVSFLDLLFIVRPLSKLPVLLLATKNMYMRAEDNVPV